MPFGATTGSAANAEKRYTPGLERKCRRCSLSTQVASYLGVIAAPTKIEKVRFGTSPCRNEKCLIAIPSTSSSATWNGATVECYRLVPNLLMPSVTTIPRSELLPRT